MDLKTITALDRAFDRLLEAADELRVAQRSEHETAEAPFSLEIDILLRVVEAEADAVNAVIRRAIRA